MSHVTQCPVLVIVVSSCTTFLLRANGLLPRRLACVVASQTTMTLLMTMVRQSIVLSLPSIDFLIIFAFSRTKDVVGKSQESAQGANLSVFILCIPVRRPAHKPYACIHPSMVVLLLLDRRWALGRCRHSRRWLHGLARTREKEN